MQTIGRRRQLKTASSRGLSRRISTPARFLLSETVGLVLFPPSPRSPRPLDGVAINAPLKEIGNPFVGTFVAMLTNGEVPTSIGTVQDFAFHLQGNVSPDWLSFSRGCTRCRRQAGERPPSRREGERSHLHGAPAPGVDLEGQPAHSTIRFACFSGGTTPTAIRAKVQRLSHPRDPGDPIGPRGVQTNSRNAVVLNHLKPHEEPSSRKLRSSITCVF